jgi:hypothetical protein
MIYIVLSRYTKGWIMKLTILTTNSKDETQACVIEARNNGKKAIGINLPRAHCPEEVYNVEVEKRNIFVTVMDSNKAMKPLPEDSVYIIPRSYDLYTLATIAFYKHCEDYSNFHKLWGSEWKSFNSKEEQKRCQALMDGDFSQIEPVVNSLENLSEKIEAIQEHLFDKFA